jgi:Holliday junction resolvase RusA-like endonuclease
VGGRARMYTPQKTVAFEAAVLKAGKPFLLAPIEGPVRLRIVAYFEMPRSWSKRKKAQMDGQYHTQKPDADNVMKAVKDALDEVAWNDDCQVADVRAVKRWSRYGETFVKVEAAK